VLKLGIIGSTGHTNYVLNGLREHEHEVVLAGIAPGSDGENIDSLQSKAFQARYQPKAYLNGMELLDQLQPDIVAIACHFHDHARYVIEALNRGIHVIVEKPVATTLADLEKVKYAYGQSKAMLVAMFGIRYTAPFVTAYQAIQEGAIGRVRLIQAQKSYRMGDRGVPFLSRQTYGGTIPWVGIHAIDWVYWLSGESFETVYAAHSAFDNKGHGELEATAMCQFTMSNEVMASVSMDYLRPKQAPSHGDDRIRLVGTEGVLEVRDQQVQLINGREEGIQVLPLLPKRELFTDFIDQVKRVGTCMVSAEDSFYVTEIGLKAVISADEKRVVSLAN
jgi:predicted dehydrogenase